MRNRLVNDFDDLLLCPRPVRIEIEDAETGPDPSAEDDEKKTHQTEEAHIAARNLFRLGRRFSRRNRDGDLAPAENGTGPIVDAHSPIFDRAD